MGELEAGQVAMLPAAVPADERERLKALEELAVLDTAPEERFDRVTRLTQRLFGVPLAYISLIDRDRQWMKSASGIPVPQEIPRSASICAHTILEPDGLVVPDLSADERFRGSGFVTEDPHLRFYASMPLAAPDGQPVGTLCIADTRPRELTPLDEALLRDLSRWVAKELNIDSELDRAAEVQRAMLPRESPGDPCWDVSGVCVPSREVGGDFFDWYRTRRGTVITVGDVMGKGMPAAIVMAAVRAGLRAGGRLPDLAAGVRAAAESLADDLDATSSFATAFVARLEDDGAITGVDAGHGHAAIVRLDGRVEPLAGGDGLPLGIDADERYAGASLQVDIGDFVLIHSDGLIELRDGPASTAEAAARIAGADSAGEALARLTPPTGGQPPPDDVTIVIAQRRA